MGYTVEMNQDKTKKKMVKVRAVFESTLPLEVYNGAVYDQSYEFTGSTEKEFLEWQQNLGEGPVDWLWGMELFDADSVRSVTVEFEDK